MAERDIILDGRKSSRIVLADDLAAATSLAGGGRRLFLLYDEAVAKTAGTLISTGKFLSHKALRTSEQLKCLATVEEICTWLLREGADRNSFLIAMGGGITTDMAGFAASVYKRGIDFGFIPTTLLGQVDAAIGGKNGVNFLSLKNMLGVIRQPAFTLISTRALQGLPWKTFASGAAEMLKTFIIDDTDGNYAKATGLLAKMKDAAAIGPDAFDKALRDNDEELSELIFAAACIKAGIVERDPFEKGERRLLNLGHTFAHAIESIGISRQKEASPANAPATTLSHGESVAIGIILAARLSEALGIAPDGLADMLKADFEKCGLPTVSPYPIEEMAPAMAKDKKADGSLVHFVLPSKIGNTVIHDLTPAEAAGKLTA